MPSPTYEAIAFLQDGSDLHLTDVAASLRRRFPEGESAVDGMTITLTVRGWTVRLHLADGLHVPAESREMAEHFSDCPRAGEIARCRRRMEVWSPDHDPGMDHFNDFVLVLEVLEGFHGVILFDPRTGSLI